MAAIVYGDFVNAQGPVRVTTIGSSSGPPGGDGWTVVARLPKSKLLASRRYVFIVSGKAGSFSWSGTDPVNGVVEIALGDSSGLKHPDYVSRYFLRDSGLSTPFFPAIPFQFCVIFSTTISDPLWGSTWSNAEDLLVYARTFRNGDPANYAPAFDVSDLCFMWWDLDAIPTADFHVEQYSPATPAVNTVSPTWTNHFATATPSGSVSEKWLHFVNVTYDPRDDGAGAANFDFGYVTDGTFGTWTPTIGSNGRWGNSMRRAALGTPPVGIRHQQGGFFPLTQPVGIGFAVGFRGRDHYTNPGRQTLVRRFRYVGIRLDNLPDVQTLSSSSQAALAGSVNTVLNQVYFPMEKTGGVYVTNPVFLTHGIVQPTGSREAFATWVTSIGGRALYIGQGFPQAEASLFEAVSNLSFARQGLGPNQPDIQYRTHFVDANTAFPSLLEVRDIHVAQFFMTRDPDRIPTAPVSPGSAAVAIPGREAPDLATLLEIPILPDIEIDEEPALEVPAIEGIQGYRRTWKMFGKPRRTFQLSWAPITEADRDTLEAFFETNVAFKMTMPKSAVATALLRLGSFESSLLSGATYSARLSAAELIFIGP